MKTLLKYLHVWWLMSRNSFISVLYAKLALVIFLFGKIIRFIFFFAFLYFLVSGSNSLAGYTLYQSIFFFLTFNLVDVVGQFLFREVYRFRPLIVSGDFDLVLLKPINALFRVLMGGADVIDLITIPPLLFALVYVGQLLHPSVYAVAGYILLVLNGLIIATAFHIFVLSFGILTLEVDNVVMIYRDLVSLGRFPVDIYREPLKSLLTYLIPIGLMMTLPAKVLMGVATPVGFVVALVFSAVLLFISLRFWHFALLRYTSASS